MTKDDKGEPTDRTRPGCNGEDFWRTIEVIVDPGPGKLIRWADLTDEMIRNAVRSSTMRQRIFRNRWVTDANVDGERIVIECAVSEDRRTCKVIEAHRR